MKNTSFVLIGGDGFDGLDGFVFRRSSDFLDFDVNGRIGSIRSLKVKIVLKMKIICSVNQIKWLHLNDVMINYRLIRPFLLRNRLKHPIFSPTAAPNLWLWECQSLIKPLTTLLINHLKCKSVCFTNGVNEYHVFRFLRQNLVGLF